MYSERSKSDNRSAAVEIYYDYLGCKLEQRFVFAYFSEQKIVGKVQLKMSFKIDCGEERDG